ncbi:hypothetical protein VTN49DRAFT_2835 [Thermomyces lanuginosus]|uniref:uncharacterized protein n=1 Tax=Thermomyces lanuginosus TaxID=5541 RepID=UPI00374287F7
MPLGRHVQNSPSSRALSSCSRLLWLDTTSFVMQKKGRARFLDFTKTLLFRILVHTIVPHGSSKLRHRLGYAGPIEIRNNPLTWTNTLN